jgi:hypothetical protein
MLCFLVVPNRPAMDFSAAESVWAVKFTFENKQVSNTSDLKNKASEVPDPMA